MPSIRRDGRRYVQHLQEIEEADPTSLEELKEQYDPDAYKNFYR